MRTLVLVLLLAAALGCGAESWQEMTAGILDAMWELVTGEAPSAPDLSEITDMNTAWNIKNITNVTTFAEARAATLYCPPTHCLEWGLDLDNALLFECVSLDVGVDGTTWPKAPAEGSFWEWYLLHLAHYHANWCT